MKRDFVKTCVFLMLSLVSIPTSASEIECDCYMEYRNIEAEAEVYIDQESKDATLTEFSAQEKMEVQQASALLAETQHEL